MSEELKPCPFCGGKANADGFVTYSKDYEAWFADGTQVREAFFVNCMKCGIGNIGMFGHQTREKAIEAWNTRVTDKAMPSREEIARALANRFIERGNARVTGSPYSSFDEMPGSYRDDFLADVDAVLALFCAQPDTDAAEPEHETSLPIESNKMGEQ